MLIVLLLLAPGSFGTLLGYAWNLMLFGVLVGLVVLAVRAVRGRRPAYRQYRPGKLK